MELIVKLMGFKNFHFISPNFLKIFGSLFFLASLILVPLIAKSQESINNLDLNIDMAEQLPSLDSLINMAVAYHPTVKFNQELEGAAEQRVRLAKKSWSTLIRGYADYSTGNQSIITTGTQGNDISNFANGYRTGLNLSIPFSEFYTRKERIKLQQQEMDAVAYKTDEMEMTIASQVIEEYNNMVTAQKVMKLQYDMQEKARSNLKLAELEYKSGNMEGPVYLRNAEIFTISQIDYETARKEFAIAIQKLELLIGTPLSQIRKSR